MLYAGKEDTEFQELEQKYLSLRESYEEALREKQEAQEENERATISFAVHFDREVSVLKDHIETLIKERDKATTEVGDLGIKLENTKYELNRLQREYIKLQLEQEKYLDKIESFGVRLKEAENEKSILNGELETLRTVKENTAMDEKKKDESILIGEEQNHPSRPPVTIKKSKVDDDYNVYEELGRGKFGVVKRVTKKTTNEEFAAKWVKVSSQTKDDVLKEIEIMGKLNHKRLVGLYDAYEVSRNIVLIMEFITGGELFERIATEESVTEKECAYYMRQLLEGLQYMHKQNIVHLDLKPENIVCVSKDTWDIKLIDFGLAKELKPGTSIKTMQGTPEFVAPEVINFDAVSLGSDMWSVGVIAYILISGLSPFLGDNDNETLSYVTTAEYDFEDDAFNEISNEAKDFIEKLLQKPPSKRKTAEECLKHEWIKKNRGNNKIKTENLKKFLAKRRWQKSVNAVRAVRRLSSMSSLFNASTKGNSKSTAKLFEPKNETKTPLATKRELSKSTPSVFHPDNAQLSKRAMKILLDSDTEESQSESGSMEQVNSTNVDDKEVLEGLFKENKEILDFLSSGLENKEQKNSLNRTMSQGKLGEISEEKDSSDEQAAEPSFSHPLPAVYTVPKGTPVLMTCKMTGCPTPNITWLRNDKALKDEDGDIRIDIEDNICTLSVGQCEVQDEGNYSCVAENHLGQTSCSTKLEVQVSPDFVHEMKDMTVAEGKRVQFDVKISGTPLPTVEWYHNDDLLQEDRWTKLRKCTDDIYSLVIRTATPERRGNYKCVITNPLDTISCSAKLHIEGYSDDEDEDEEVDEEENQEDDEVDNCDDHAHVSLRQEDIELYYDVKEEIGKGRFGVIRYGIHKATGRDYAIKYIKVRKSQRDQFQQEIDIMNHLRHRRYIRLYEAFEEPRRLILVLELMRGGELLERVAESEYIAEHAIIKYVKQILEGVKDMHEKGVLHLDLKPQNIMFTTQEGSNLKLIDFGLARKLSGEKDLKIFFGTPEFVAPEVVNYEVITPATDMWSVGVITYILLSGVSPFWNDDPDITLANVTRAEWRLPDLLFQGVSDDAKDFLSKLLAKDPSKRMKVEDAFQHPWIQDAQNEEEKTNLISTKRLRKYHANQKGLVGSRDVALREPTNTTREKPKDKIREDTKIKINDDVEPKGDADSRLDTITKERNELNQQLEALLEKQNQVEEELFSVKAANKEQQSVLNGLEKRNKLLEERNRANQEATQRLIKLECDKRDIEDKFQQKEKKYKDLSKKYENVREKADSYDILEEKVLHLEKERKTSQTNCKKIEEKLKQLREENAALQNQGFQGTRASITEEDEEDVVDREGKTSDKREMENKLKLLSKELEIAQAEIQRLNTVVNSQLEDLEEMERITEHKRKLETRCKGLEEQLVEQEHEGAQREKEIDEMEDDIVDLQGKLQKSHKELRTVLEENKQLKKHWERLEKGREESKNGNATLLHDKTETTRDVSHQNGHPLTNGFKKSFEDDSNNNNNNTKKLMEENGKLSVKCYELEKEMQELMSKTFGDSIDENARFTSAPSKSLRGDTEEKEDSNTGSVQEEEDYLVTKNADWESLSENMDIKQLRQLTKKLMKANKALLSANENLNHEKQQVEIRNEQLKDDFDKKIQALEKENETFKRLLKAGDNIDAVDEILNKTTIEALECELSNQQGRISDLKKTNEDLQQSKMEQRIEEESTQWRLEQKIETMNNDKSLLVFKYEKELEESYNFFSEEQSKFKRLYEERIASVEKQNQNLKAQINELIRFNDSKKNSCDEHVQNLNELKRLHHEEIQELERNMALTLSQQVHTLTSLNEHENEKLTKEKDEEINKLNNNCKDLNEVITNLQDQVTKYPELLGENEDLKNELIVEKQRYEMLEKEMKVKERTETCKNCERLRSRVSELENELVALRKLEEDNMLLASENEKLIEELDFEREKLVLASNNNVTDSESKMKLEELDNEKSLSKLKENSKKFLKKKVSQLENDCKDLSRKLQGEILKSKQHELRISRETTEKEKVLQALLKAQSSLNSKHVGQVNEVKQNRASSLLDSDIPVSVVDDKDTISVDEEKDNDYHMMKEELKKTQNRTHLLQTEIDRLRESYSNNLSKELEEMENKWTQRLRRECNAVHSEMAEEYRKQKEAWRKKESELHCVIKELQIQVEETETDRKRLEQECNELKGKLQNGTRVSGHISKFPAEEERTTYTVQEEKDENLIQDSISDRDLRRVAYKLKKDQWSRLAKFLGLTDADIREIDQQKVGKEEKAFRVLCQWRTSVELAASNPVSLLALALEEIRRKDLAQFVMEHCMAGKYKKKLIGW